MELSIAGQTYTFKDCKVWPDGAKEWDWDLTGTRHQPGTQPADIEELLEIRPTDPQVRLPPPPHSL
jgi:hypothetical protein